MRIFTTIYLLFFSLSLYSSSSKFPVVTLHDCDDGESVYSCVKTTTSEEHRQGRRVILALDIDGNLLETTPLDVILSSFGKLLNDDPHWQDLVYGLVYITARDCINWPNITQSTHSQLQKIIGEVYRFSQSERNFMGCGIHREENFTTSMKLSKGVLIMGGSPYNKAEAAHWLFNTYQLPKHDPGYTLIFSDDDLGWRIGFLGNFSPPNFYAAHCIHYDVAAEARKNTLRFLSTEDDGTKKDCLLSSPSCQSISSFPLPNITKPLPSSMSDDELDDIFKSGPWVSILDKEEQETPPGPVET